MKKVFFVVNAIRDFSCFDYIEKYLSDVEISVGECFPYSSDEYDLIILWSFRKIINNLGDKKNVVLFHSSDLPEGKGWAPIYNALNSKKERFVITGIKAANEVDSGVIIVKASFQIKDNYLAENIREWDNEISIILISEILLKFEKAKIIGLPQVGKGTFFHRRRPDQNEINIDSTFIDLLPHIRGCEKEHPAYFLFNNERFNIYIEPVNKPLFPSDLEIVFFDK